MMIGGDGGLQERPVTSDALLVTPGERVDVIVTPTGKPGTRSWSARCSTTAATAASSTASSRTCSRSSSANQPPLPKCALPQGRARDRAAGDGRRDAGRRRADAAASRCSTDKSEFRVNGVPFWKAKPYLAKLGETQLWTVKNDTKWDHPFHLHGFFFMRARRARAADPADGVEGHRQHPDEDHRPVARDFDERPGEWMFHCHILDHADGGLMGTVRVGPVKPAEHVHRTP